MNNNFYRNRLRNHIRCCRRRNSFERFEILHAIELFCRINAPDRSRKINPEFSADDIFKLLEEKLGIFSKSTVYRALSLMLEAGIIVETGAKSGGRKFYQLVPCNDCSAHLHCIKCERIIGISEPGLKNFIDEICLRENFDRTGAQLCIKGICAKCREELNDTGDSRNLDSGKILKQ